VNLKSVLLGFLADRDMSGYDLKAMMERSVGFFFGATYGSIYPALRELEQGGLVEKTTIVQQERPNKNLYRITPAGTDYLQAQMRTPPAPDTFRSELLIRLFFGKHTQPAQLLEWVAQNRSLREEHLKTLHETDARIPKHAHFAKLCHRYGIRHYTSTLQWLDDVEAEIRTLDRQPEGGEPEPLQGSYPKEEKRQKKKGRKPESEKGKNKGNA
jgi:DNA-binding PadR family transcriptional regulator